MASAAEAPGQNRAISINSARRVFAEARGFCVYAVHDQLTFYWIFPRQMAGPGIRVLDKANPLTCLAFHQ